MRHNRKRIRLETDELVRRPPRTRTGTGFAPGQRLRTTDNAEYEVQRDGSWRRVTPKAANKRRRK